MNSDECKPLHPFFVKYFGSLLKVQNIGGSESKTNDLRNKLVEGLEIFRKGNQNFKTDKIFIIDNDSWEKVNLKMKNWKVNFDKQDQNNLFSILLPFIFKRLSGGEDLSVLVQHEIFTKDQNSSIYGITEKVFLIFLIEVFPEICQQYINLYTKLPGKSVPLLYKTVTKQEPFKLALKEFFFLLSADNPIILSIGPKNCGKSNLLNHLFFLTLDKHSKESYHVGIDAVFHSNEFKIGFNIFDFQGDFLENQKIFCASLKCLPNDTWIVLHAYEKDEAHETLKLLVNSLKINGSQIICLLRDFGSTIDGKKKWSYLDQNKIKKSISELKIPSDNILNIGNIFELKGGPLESSVNTLRDNLSKITGKCLEPNKPVNHSKISNSSLMKEFQNKISKLNNEDKLVLNVSLNNKEFFDFSKQIEDLFNSEGKNPKNGYSEILFINVTLRNKTTKECENLTKINPYLLSKEKMAIKTEITNKIKELSDESKTLKIHQLSKLFFEIIEKNDHAKRIEFENRLQIWQRPILDPIFEMIMDLKKKQNCFETKIKNNNLVGNNSNQNPKKLNTLEINNLLKVFSEEIKRLSALKVCYSVNREHFWREAIELCGKSDEQKSKCKLNETKFFEGFADYVRKGGEFELMDGDNNTINENALSKLFSHFHKKEEKSDLFVVSIIGPQSTGKSTFLNFLFNSNFQMSAGRCTQGLYGSLLKTNFPKAQDCLVLDSEGLLSIERGDESFDRKITTFAMAMSQVMIVNVNGEMNESMKKIIEISLFAAKQLQICYKKKPIVFFVLRNMNDVDKKKQAAMIEHLDFTFVKVAELSGVKMNDIIDYRGSDSFELFQSAYNNDFNMADGEQIFSFCRVNSSFRASIDHFREALFKEATRDDAKPFFNLHTFLSDAVAIWKAIETYKDFTQYSSIQEINNRNALSKIVSEIKEICLNSTVERDENNSLYNILKKELENAIKKQLSDNEFKTKLSRYEDVFKSRVQTEFEDKIKNGSFELNLKNEYQKMLTKEVERIRREFEEDWTYCLSSLNSKTEVNNLISSINSIMNKCRKDFQKDSASIKNKDNLSKFKNEVIANFINEVENTRTNFEKSLEDKKKTHDYLMTKTFEILTSYCNTENIVSIFFTQNLFNQIFNAQSINNFGIFGKEVSRYELAEFNKCLAYNNEYVSNIYRQNKKKTFDESNTKQKIKKKSKFEEFSIKKIPEIIESLIVSDIDNYYNIEKLNYKKLKKAGQIYDSIFDTLKKVFSFCDQTKLSHDEIRLKIKQLTKYLDDLQEKELASKKMYLEMNHLKYYIGDFIFRKVYEKLSRDDELERKKLLKDFDDAYPKLLKQFKYNLESTLGDEKLAEYFSHNLLQNIKECLSEQIKNKSKTDLEESTRKDPDSLSSEVDEFVIGSGSYIFDSKEEDHFLFATDLSNYMIKYYKTKIFDSKLESIKNNKKMKVSDDFQSIVSIIKSAIDDFSSFFSDDLNVKEQELSKDESKHNEVGFRFFNLLCDFLIGNDNSDDFNYLSKNGFIKKHFKSINFREKFSNINLLHGEKDKNSSKILSPVIFCEFFKKYIEEQSRNFNFSEVIRTNDVSHIYNRNLNKSIGCLELCPYCGAKCTDANDNHTKHSAKKHRIMGFKGSWNYDASGKKELLVDVCDSIDNIINSKWINVSNSNQKEVTVKADAKLREKLIGYNATIGKLNFSLEWFDPNDLDLHVVCPCGIEIYFRNKKCETCKSYLDLDMNAYEKFDVNEPSEHVFVEANPKPGIYKIQVNFYSIRTFNNKTGGISSNFKLTIHDSNDNIKQQFTDTVKKNETREYEYHHSPGIKFLDHCKSVYPNWMISSKTANNTTAEEACYNSKLGSILEAITPRLKKHYGLK